jgi:hypothetical protein
MKGVRPENPSLSVPSSLQRHGCGNNKKTPQTQHIRPFVDVPLVSPIRQEYGRLANTRSHFADPPTVTAVLTVIKIPVLGLHFACLYDAGKTWENLLPLIAGVYSGTPLDWMHWMAWSSRYPTGCVYLVAPFVVSILLVRSARMAGYLSPLRTIPLGNRRSFPK